MHIRWDKRIGPVLSAKFLGQNIAVCLCHRREDRSLKIHNYTIPLCSRCTGQIIGIILAIILFIFDFKLSLIISFLLMIPMVLDGFTQTFLRRESKNVIRLTTGLLFSFGLIYFTLWWLYV